MGQGRHTLRSISDPVLPHDSAASGMAFPTHIGPPYVVKKQ